MHVFYRSLRGTSCFFFFKQKTAYEMRISDWSSDVCSSDLLVLLPAYRWLGGLGGASRRSIGERAEMRILFNLQVALWVCLCSEENAATATAAMLVFSAFALTETCLRRPQAVAPVVDAGAPAAAREEGFAQCAQSPFARGAST